MTSDALAILRAAGLDDAAAMAVVHAACFAQGWTEADMRPHLNAANAIAFVAANAQTPDLMGFVLARLVAQDAEILSLAVRPQHRRGGIGKRLLTLAEQEIARRGGGDLFLEVAADNEAAIALYRNCDLRTGGRRAGYYVRSDRPAVDALVLTKRISPFQPND